MPETKRARARLRCLGLASVSRYLSSAYLIPWEIWHNKVLDRISSALKTSLFKKPWESKDEATRAQAVASSDHPKLIERLPHLAQHDASAQVRLAALKRLNKEAFWLDARRPDQDPSINQAADHALLNGVLHEETSKFQQQRLAWLEQLIQEDQHRATLKTIAREAKHPDFRALSLQSIHAAGFLADCYLSEPNPAIAAQILGQIDQKSPLERILPEVKKRSKAKTLALEEKLEALAGLSQEDKDEQAALACLQAIERLILGPGDAGLAAQWAALQAKWRSIPSPSSALQTRFAQAQKIIEATLNPPARSEPITKPQENGETEPTRPAEPIETPQPKPAPKPKGPKPTDAETLGSVVKDAKDRLAEAEVAIDEGHLKSAHEQLALLPKPLPRSLQSQASRVYQKFNELKRWLHWSNNTHRDELIEQLEHALTQSLHPDALTAVAKEATARWRALESSEQLGEQDAKPVAPHRQWRRYTQALASIREATQPALAHRKQYQEDNWTALQTFLDQTQTWLTERRQQVNGNTKEVLEPLKTCRAAIRRLNDLPPKKRGQAAESLKALMTALSNQVEASFAAVEAQKRKLVAQAEQLSHEKDKTVAIEKAKSLQAQWRAIGPGRRASDQSLWQAFRAPIDPLFAELKEASEAQRAEQQAHFEHLNELITEIESLVKAGDFSSAECKATWTRLNDQWQSEGPRPAKLESRFNRAKASIDQQLLDLKRQAKAQAKKSIVDWAHAIQRALGNGQPNSASGITAPPKPLGTQWEPIWETLNSTLTNMQEASSDLEGLQNDLASHDQCALEVVVELEFLAGIDTPSKDETIKKAFQVQRLNERLNQRGQAASLAEDLKQRNERWYQCIPMSPGAYAALQPRFERAVEALENMLG